MVAAIAHKRARKSNREFDDLYQEGSIALWKAYQNWDSSRGVKLITYCYECVYWAVFDYAHPKKRQKHAPQVLMGNPIEPFYDGGTDEVDRRDEIDVVVRGRLSGRQLEVIDLRLQGYNGAQIARKLGVSREAVRSIQNRVFEKIRNGR